MTRFSDEVDSAARGLDFELYGEAVTYYPSAGGSRSITVVVDRETSQPIRGEMRSVNPYIVVWAENDATTGITIDEIDDGGDELEVALEIEGTATRRTIALIDREKSDESYTVFTVQ